MPKITLKSFFKQIKFLLRIVLQRNCPYGWLNSFVPTVVCCSLSESINIYGFHLLLPTSHFQGNSTIPPLPIHHYSILFNQRSSPSPRYIFLSPLNQLFPFLQGFFFSIFYPLRSFIFRINGVLFLQDSTIKPLELEQSDIRKETNIPFG